MDLSILESGLTVLCLGFSVVFCFLAVLIISMNIMSKVVGYLNKLFPVAAVSAVAPKKVSVSVDEDIAVAIAAALLKRGR